MATIRGSHRKDFLNGSSGGDTIYGNDGYDEIWGGFGVDTIFGGNHDDIITAGTPWSGTTRAAWGWDSVVGGGHNDYINYYYSTDRVTVWGDDMSLSSTDGDDIIYTGSNRDTIYGGAMNDQIYAGAGNDVIYGDHVGKGSGDDLIMGGYGSDQIWTGPGDDVIYYQYATESHASFVNSDVIYDFNDYRDFIDIPGWGTSRNYIEDEVYGGQTLKASFDLAFQKAYYYVANSRDIVFLTNQQNGYLFADTNGDNRIDMAIELRGLNSLDDFGWNNVI